MLMKRHIRVCLFLFLVLPILSASAQPASAPSHPGSVPSAQSVARPRLVVGIVVDQMRWDYLYRYYARYSNGGFKRLLNEGFSCENTFISHLPSYTAVGHSTIFTGSVPAFHGITGNDWIDQASGRSQYCTGDSTVAPVGGTSPAGNMSPRNLLATTITDELRLATNFQSKVVGVSLKDRASILPAGHTPTAAFWFDDHNGVFSTSTWYMKDLPEWVKKFNGQNEPEKLVAGGWNTLYPIDTYTQSTADNQPWEGTFPGESAPVFPHDMARFYKLDHDNIRSSPFGNTLTLDFARAAIEGYSLGRGTTTDFLTINCASTDYVSHKFGPNSIEVEDVYLRLDKDLSAFFTYLDTKIGKGNYLVFLTADHGGSHSVDFLKEHGIPGNLVESRNFMKILNDTLAAHFGVKDLVISTMNYYLSFNHAKIDNAHLDFAWIKKVSLDFLRRQPGIQFAVDVNDISSSTVPEPLKTMIINGYNYRRCGEITFVPEPGWFDGSRKGTTHGTWNPQDTHIPLLFMGWGIRHGALHRTVHMTDIAPTVAAILHIQMPDACVGQPIEEVKK